jgi:hypothetical protein
MKSMLYTYTGKAKSFSFSRKTEAKKKFPYKSAEIHAASKKGVETLCAFLVPTLSSDASPFRSEPMAKHLSEGRCKNMRVSAA